MNGRFVPGPCAIRPSRAKPFEPVHFLHKQSHPPHIPRCAVVLPLSFNYEDEHGKRLAALGTSVLDDGRAAHLGRDREIPDTTSRSSGDSFHRQAVRGSCLVIAKPAAAAIASIAYVVPYLLSRSTTPTPNHPRVFLWYRGLRQPAFKPPDVAIPLAWMGVESGLAYAAYQLLQRPSSAARTRALALLGGNVIGIGGWSRLFFGGRNLPVSTVAAASLGVAAVAYVNETRKVDKVAAASSVPLVVWVAFATVLTAAIWQKNRR